LVAALSVIALSPIAACSQAQPGLEKPAEHPRSVAVVPLQGSLPGDPDAAALRLEKITFPAGANRMRIFVVAPGLKTGTTEASGYLGSVSPSQARDLQQDVQLRLDPVQVRALMSNEALTGEKTKPTIAIEAFDRSGKPVPGAKAAVAILVDGRLLTRDAQ